MIDTANLSHSQWCPVVEDQLTEPGRCDCGAERAEEARQAMERDAARYRRFRELVEYGDFLLSDARVAMEEANEIDYAQELDAALDDPDTARRGDSLIKLRAERPVKVTAPAVTPAENSQDQGA